MLPRAGPFAAILLALLLVPVLRPLPGGAQPIGGPGSLDDLAFMSGCWRAETPGGATLEEFYTRPAENLMLGVSRFLRGGRVVEHEFSRITADSSGVVLLPFPGGTPSEHAFRLTAVEGRRAVFEAPEHDFPRRILYEGGEDGSLTARIDGGAGSPRAREWRMEPVPCWREEGGLRGHDPRDPLPTR